MADRLVGACPAPALLIEADGRLRLASAAAVDLLGLDPATAGAGTPVRGLLGVGWRELAVISHNGDADLVADLPPTADGRRRGARVRVEPVSPGDGSPQAIVAFLETLKRPAAARSWAPTREARWSGTRGAGFDAIFGHDAALVAAKEAAARFARTQLPVLLLAETGTGKELFARALHEASERSDQPFVAINCGALSPHLLESELFGYAPGAFTGASRDGHPGKIGAARGGTLLLDEVAEMPGPLQALLLRVLEDGTYYRVGGRRPRQADVRLICATCRDLPRLVADGAFRQDLFYRINGACLSLPPLRRRTDVADLVLHLLDLLADQGELGGTRRPRLSPEAREWLVNHPWPGNVRELKTALQHALILCEGDEIRPEHLPARLEGLISAVDGDTPGTSSPAVPDSPPAPTRTLAEREADRLARAVEDAAGNLSRAARDLGIARSTLYRRLRKHGLIA